MHRSLVKTARNKVGKAVSKGRRWPTEVGRGDAEEVHGTVVEAKGSGAERDRAESSSGVMEAE